MKSLSSIKFHMQEKKHFFYLSAFRLLAAILVLIQHARCQLFVTYPDLNPDSQNIFTQLFFGGINWTSEALAIFFVLSGFLVGGPQLKKLNLALLSDDVEFNSRNILKNFAAGRFVRILVPLFFAILFAAMVKSYSGIDYSWTDAFLNLLGLQGVLAHDFGEVFWTLAYEIWFYILIAGILSVFCGSRLRICGIILVLLSSFVFVKLPVSWFFMFLIGIGLYYMKDLAFPKCFIGVCLMGIALIKVLNILSVDSHVVRFSVYGMLNGSMLNVALALCCGLIMLLLSRKEPNGGLSRWIEEFGNKWSGFTYSLYITHFTVLELYKHLFGQFKDVDFESMMIYVLINIVCLVFGHSFYRLIEIRLGQFLKSLILQKA